MKKIKISDISLCGNSVNSLSFREKLDFAKKLDKIKTDFIEVGPICDATDGVLVKTICSFLQNSAITCIATTKEEIDNAVEAVSQASKKRIQILIPSSIVQIEFNLHIKPQVLVDQTAELVAYAKSKCDDVEVAFVDATRAEDAVLESLIESAIKNGANAITIVDNAGAMFADEFEKFVENLYDEVKGIKKVDLYVQATNRFQMSTALSFTAVKAGAIGIKTQQKAESASSLQSVFETVREIGDKHKISVNISATNIINTLTQDNSSKKNLVKKEENVEIEIADIKSLERWLKSSGYELESQEVKKVFEVYRNLRKKKIVGSKELDVIVATVTAQVPETYRLINFVVNSGNIITATTNVTLERDGMTYSGISAGDGPIDASFKAIESIVGRHYELYEFNIGSITEGREAIGEAVVKIINNGKIYSGAGISTDIIGASIQAFLSALNKVLYEDNK